VLDGAGLRRQARPEVWAAANLNVAEGFVPQHHELGAKGEVD
jgi:hypothetical protein